MDTQMTGFQCSGPNGQLEKFVGVVVIRENFGCASPHNMIVHCTCITPSGRCEDHTTRADDYGECFMFNKQHIYQDEIKNFTDTSQKEVYQTNNETPGTSGSCVD